MSRANIPPEIAEFIVTTIDSVAEMEALILLRSQPAHSWSSAALAKQLYITDQQAGETLRRLAARGLAAQSDGEGFRYEAQDPALDQLAGQSIDYYSKHLVPITNMIHAKPRRIQHFADAFRIVKKE